MGKLKMFQSKSSVHKFSFDHICLLQPPLHMPLSGLAQWYGSCGHLYSVLKTYANSAHKIESEAKPNKIFCVVRVNMATEHCCVPHCSESARKNKKIQRPEDRMSFHHFPKSEQLRKEWIVKIRRDPGPKFVVSCD